MITTGFQDLHAASVDQGGKSRRATTDTQPQFDIRDLARLGLLGDNINTFKLSWPSRDADLLLGVQVLRDETDLRVIGLKVCNGQNGGHGANGQHGDTVDEDDHVEASEPGTDLIPIVHTGCHYGGTRPWFQCPGCSIRVAILYLRSDALKCRRCHRLVYRSTRETMTERAARRVGKLRARLGDHDAGVDPFDLQPVPPRPPGMHQATYDRLGVELLMAEDAYSRLFRERVMGVAAG